MPNETTPPNQYDYFEEVNVKIEFDPYIDMNPNEDIEEDKVKTKYDPDIDMNPNEDNYFEDVKVKTEFDMNPNEDDYFEDDKVKTESDMKPNEDDYFDEDKVKTKFDADTDMNPNEDYYFEKAKVKTEFDSDIHTNPGAFESDKNYDIDKEDIKDDFKLFNIIKTEEYSYTHFDEAYEEAIDNIKSIIKKVKSNIDEKTVINRGEFLKQRKMEMKFVCQQCEEDLDLKCFVNVRNIIHKKTITCSQCNFAYIMLKNT